MLKKSKIFDDEGTADEDDKLMFKEITELNDERIRLDEYDELNAARRDPKKSLNRLSQFVDEVHDILMTVNIKEIMRSYWATIEKKAQVIGDLTKNMATIKLIPPSLLNKDVRAVYELE